MILLLLFLSYLVPLFTLLSARFYLVTRFPEGRWKRWEDHIDHVDSMPPPYELQYMFWPLALVGWVVYLSLDSVFRYPFRLLVRGIGGYIEFIERRAIRAREQKLLPRAKIEK